MWQQSRGVGWDGQHIVLLQHQYLRLSSSSLGSTYSVMQSFHLQWRQKQNHQNHWGPKSIKKLWVVTWRTCRLLKLIAFRGDENTLHENKQCFWHVPPGMSIYKQGGFGNNAPGTYGSIEGIQILTSGHLEASLGSQCAWPVLGPGTQCSSCIPLCVTGQAQLPVMAPQSYWEHWHLPLYPQDLGWTGATDPCQAATRPTEQGDVPCSSCTPPLLPLATRWFSALLYLGVPSKAALES